MIALAVVLYLTELVHLLSNNVFDSSLYHGHSCVASEKDNRFQLILKCDINNISKEVQHHPIEQLT